MHAKIARLGLLAAFGLHFTRAANMVANFTSTSCASPNGFDSCYNEAANAAASCLAASASAEETLACTCVEMLQEINCAAANCWNEVYSCQYQSLILQYMKYCPAGDGDFPYFPAPANAPGGCSCNIGEVYLNATNSLNEVTSLCKNPTSIAEGTACYCCMEASALTSIYGLCPNTNPALIGLGELENTLAVFDIPFDQCGSYLEQYDCVKDIGFAPVGTATFINPNSMPANGTETLYTTGASITSPVSGDIVTWSHASTVYTATAAAVTQDAGGSPSSATATPGASGTASGSAHSTPSTAGAAHIADINGLAIGFLILGLFYL